MPLLSCILDLQNVEEYYDFVQQLQAFTSYPPIEENKDGVFIVLKLTTTRKLRKMRLGLAYTKEVNASNLSCYTFDSKNQLTRATTSNGRYNFLNNECIIVGCVYFLTSFSQNKKFFLTGFPLQLEITRKIVQNPSYLPTFYYGLLNTYNNTVRTDGKRVEPNILVTIRNETIAGTLGVGSGVGISVLDSSVVNDAVPVDTSQPGSLQIPANLTLYYTIIPVPLGTYLVFQIPVIGDQNNIVTVVKVGGQTLFNPPFPVVAS